MMNILDINYVASDTLEHHPYLVVLSLLLFQRADLILPKVILTLRRVLERKTCQIPLLFPSITHVLYLFFNAKVCLMYCLSTIQYDYLEVVEILPELVVIRPEPVDLRLPVLVGVDEALEGVAELRVEAVAVVEGGGNVRLELLCSNKQILLAAVRSFLWV